MIAYHEVNEYLDAMELPKSIEEILTIEYELEGKELKFLSDAKHHLENSIDLETYRFKEVHCIGCCKINLTRTGMYFLLDEEIIGVHTSIIKGFSDEADWQTTQFHLKDIKELDFDQETTSISDFETGILFLKVLNERGAIRNRTFRNLNPNHFQCFRDFHSNVVQNKMI
ncbi:hypothetical protein ACFOLA_02975 [Salinicoccus hispanicus]|uniref:YokE-like PH domain-containing protein n=1 Tax=Salinicoccus hispanicus TaxID=157225 RepID=A0A6N8U4L8_9STAP|nr:hypothetical protein [Salinicoccus hispanicus]MXQ50549.1 hypothetical protein [Salinicoccus hispanicus]